MPYILFLSVGRDIEQMVTEKSVLLHPTQVGMLLVTYLTFGSLLATNYGHRLTRQSQLRTILYYLSATFRLSDRRIESIDIRIKESLRLLKTFTTGLFLEAKI